MRAACPGNEFVPYRRLQSTRLSCWPFLPYRSLVLVISVALPVSPSLVISVMLAANLALLQSSRLGFCVLVAS
jgi:hypothetical protein